MIINIEKSYVVRRRSSSDDDKFGSADLLSDFCYPWENTIAPPVRFSAVHDRDWLHCQFSVTDKNVLTYVSENKKEEVLLGDRVEIFFSVDVSLSSYYCLEVDPNGRVYDYHASHYRKFNATWQWPEDQLRIMTEKFSDGYKVALSIGKESLKDLNLLHGNKLIAGVFRGKCMEINLNEDRMRWISWVKPDSLMPDFHIPSAFGALILE